MDATRLIGTQLKLALPGWSLYRQLDKFRLGLHRSRRVRGAYGTTVVEYSCCADAGRVVCYVTRPKCNFSGRQTTEDENDAQLATGFVKSSEGPAGSC